MPLFSGRYSAVRQWASSVSEPHRFKMDWDAPFKRSGSPNNAESSPTLLPQVDLDHRRNGMVLDFYPSLDLGFGSTHESPSKMATGASNVLAPIVEEDRTGRSIAPHLAVKVQLRIADPRVWTAYSRDYVSSAGFQPAERLCRGLLRRIEHCSEELITRKDSLALVQRDGRQRRKPLRFEMVFTIVRHPGGPWAERTFRSYQKQPLTEEFATEIVLSMHRMIGIFLRHHDKSFRWTKEPKTDHCFGSLMSMPLSLNDPMALSCIPPSRFIEATQNFQFVPGYSIELAFMSRCRARTSRYEWTRTLKLKSGQDAPLTLARGENLLWDVHRVVENLLDRKKQDFDEEHQSCDWLEGPAECEHYEEGDALRIDLTITNNLGPVLKNLHRNTSTQLSLFRHPNGDDCHAFMREVQRGLQEARNKADTQMSRMNDFELRILELRAPAWRAERPARFCLDGKVSYSQRSIGAILDRVQTGVGDVLRGRKVTIHITAYKRGHLILDKALVARSEGPEPESLGCDHPQAEKDIIISRLTHRIQQDLDRITKDTCSIDDLPEDEPMPSPMPPSRPPTLAPMTSLEPLFSFENAGRIIGEQVDTLSRSPTITRTPSLTPSLTPPSAPLSPPPPPPVSPPVVMNNRFPLPPSRPQRRFLLVPQKSPSDDSPAESISSTVTSPRTPRAAEATFESPMSSPQIFLTPGSPRSPRSPGHNYVISDEGITVVQPVEDHNDDQRSFYEEASSDEDEDDGATVPSAGDTRYSRESSATTGTSMSVPPDHATAETALEESVKTKTAADATRAVEPEPELEPANKDDSEATAAIPSNNNFKPMPQDKGQLEEAETQLLTPTPARQGTPTGRPVPNDRRFSHIDNESTPSTPGLSCGGDPSPRGSMLITPTFPRTLSITPLDPVVKTVDDEDEETPRAATAAAASEDRLAQMAKCLTDSPTLGRDILVANGRPDRSESSRLPPSVDDDIPRVASEHESSSRSPALNPEDEFSRTKASFDFDDQDQSRPQTSSSLLAKESEQPAPLHAEEEVEPQISLAEIETDVKAEDKPAELVAREEEKKPAMLEASPPQPPQLVISPDGNLGDFRHYPVVSQTRVFHQPLSGWLEHAVVPVSFFEIDDDDDEDVDDEEEEEEEENDEDEAGADENENEDGYAPLNHRVLDLIAGPVHMMSPIPEEPLSPSEDEGVVQFGGLEAALVSPVEAVAPPATIEDVSQAAVAPEIVGEQDSVVFPKEDASLVSHVVIDEVEPAALGKGEEEATPALEVRKDHVPSEEVESVTAEEQVLPAPALEAKEDHIPSEEVESVAPEEQVLPGPGAEELSGAAPTPEAEEPAATPEEVVSASQLRCEQGRAISNHEEEVSVPEQSVDIPITVANDAEPVAPLEVPPPVEDLATATEPEANVSERELASQETVQPEPLAVASAEEPLPVHPLVQPETEVEVEVEVDAEAQAESEEASSSDEDAQQLRRKRSLPPLAPLLLSRDSISSWEDYNSLCTRDSVDTAESVLEEQAALHSPFLDHTDGGDPSSPEATAVRRRSIPTAGYLGLLLQETKRGVVEFGLRGALVGSHRFDGVDSSTYSHGSGRSRPQSSGTDATVRAYSRSGSAKPSPALPMTPGVTTPTTASSMGMGSIGMGMLPKSPASTGGDNNSRRLHVRKRAKSASRGVSKLKHHLGRPSAAAGAGAAPPRVRAKSASAAAELMIRREDDVIAGGEDHHPAAAAAETRQESQEGGGKAAMLPRFMRFFSGSK